MLNAIRTIEHRWIPLRDGRRLAARFFMPDFAGTCPAVVEYNPYRSSDITRARDNVIHGYFAERGYVSVRVDISGTGDSDGVLTDEYSDREICDLEEAIDYIGRQAWCSGDVGVFGHSWGAYSALLVALRRPPRLKAIIPVMGSDDRYNECVHYNGGCLLTSNLVWASFMQVYAALPPSPEVVGRTWLMDWRRRLAVQPLWAGQWMRPDQGDPYWQQGSVAPNYGLINCPIHFFAGTEDRYRDVGFRLLENCTSFVKLTLGPWDHCYPHEAATEPLDFPAEAVRWWDRWLKGVRNGVETEAKTSIWLSGSNWRGAWVSPLEGPLPQSQNLSEGIPGGHPPLEPSMDTDWVISKKALSKNLPCTDSYVQFWGKPLANDTDIIGMPELSCSIAGNATRQLVARLYEVQADGNVVEITRGSLRLVDPAPGTRHISLNTVAWRLASGSRLCAIIADALWPAVAPVPGDTFEAQSISNVVLQLPVARLVAENTEAARGLHAASPAGITVLAPPATKIESHEYWTGERAIRIASHAGIFGDYTRMLLPETSTEIEHTVTTEYRLNREGVSRSTAIHDFGLFRKDWGIRIQGAFSLASGAAGDVLTGNIRAFVNGEEVFHKQWPDKLIAQQSGANLRVKAVMQEVIQQ